MLLLEIIHALRQLAPSSCCKFKLTSNQTRDVFCEIRCDALKYVERKLHILRQSIFLVLSLRLLSQPMLSTFDHRQELEEHFFRTIQCSFRAVSRKIVKNCLQEVYISSHRIIICYDKNFP